MKFILRFALINCIFLISLSTSSILSAQADIGQNKALDKPTFANGEAQIVPAFENPKAWIRHDLWVETEFDSDGDGKLDRMHVGVTRPRQTETMGLKLPVIYSTSPYFAGTGGSGAREYLWDVKHELQTEPPKRRFFEQFYAKVERPIISNYGVDKWVPRGFVVVHSSSPGTGLSQGCPTVGCDNESLAPKAVIDWLNGRAKGYATPDGNEEVLAYWSTGKVGMIGCSYNGTLPLAAATTGVDGLEAIIPIAPNTSYYHYYRTNGLIRHPYGWLGEDIDFLYDWIHSGNPDKYDFCNCNVRDKEMYENFDRVTGDYNEFWAGRDYVNDMGPLKAAVLMVHSFNDWNVVADHSFRIIKEIKKKGTPLRIYYHQQGHCGTIPDSLINRWFTHYLFDIENGIEQEPRAWIVRGNDDMHSPTPYDDYPNPEASPVNLHLTRGNPKAGTLSLEKVKKQGTETIIDNVSFSGSVLAQAEYTNHRLMFLSPILKEPVHISGLTKVNIKLAISKPAANLSVWIVSLPWNEDKDAPRGNINANIVSRGWADPQNYKSIWESEPLVPGKFYEMSFNLQPDDQVIPVGQQIGVMIFSSDRDFTLWPEPGTQLTIDLDKTTIEIPVVGGVEAYKKATKQ